MTADYQAPLVPATSTEQIKALSRAAAFSDALWSAALRAGDARADRAAATLPFLVWEYGLDEVAPWVPDLATLLADGREWQRIRGTPASIAQALSWIDAPFVALEENPGDSWWDLFQLALEDAAEAGDLPAIVALARLSKPAHTDLARIYSGYDQRALTLDGEGMIGGEGLIGDWSGVWLQDGWPKISLGRRIAGADRVAEDEFDDSGRLTGVLACVDEGPLTSTPTAASASVTVRQAGAATLGAADRGYALGAWPAGAYFDPDETTSFVLREGAVAAFAAVTDLSLGATQAAASTATRASRDEIGPGHSAGGWPGGPYDETMLSFAASGAETQTAP